jgi:hypothetical protein
MFRKLIIFFLFLNFIAPSYATSDLIGNWTIANKKVKFEFLEGFFPKGKILLAQTMIPSKKNICPSGSRRAGSGYCRSVDGSNFVSSNRNLCPSGSRRAGAGYCRSKPGIKFVPSNKNLCPSGSRRAGAGYCRLI